MPRRLTYTLVAAVLAATPVPATPLHPDTPRAQYRDLFLDKNDHFVTEPIPLATPMPPTPVSRVDPPVRENRTSGPRWIGIALAVAGVVLLLTTTRGRRAWP